uniref:Secreted protein n=1 Tax=Anopheles darlingi TaxID=43151 RepID=A0A2M4DQX7_ANODA
MGRMILLFIPLFTLSGSAILLLPPLKKPHRGHYRVISATTTATATATTMATFELFLFSRQMVGGDSASIVFEPEAKPTTDR